MLANPVSGFVVPNWPAHTYEKLLSSFQCLLPTNSAKLQRPHFFTANTQGNTGFLDFALGLFRWCIGLCNIWVFVNAWLSLFFQCAPTAHLLATNTGGIASTWSSWSHQDCTDHGYILLWLDEHGLNFLWCEVSLSDTFFGIIWINDTD